MSDVLTLKFEDAYGNVGSFQLQVQSGLGPANADLLAGIQDIIDMTQAQLISATLNQEVALGGFTNPVASAAGQFDRIDDQAVLQARREDGSGFTRMTVPAPVDAIFVTSGPKAYADVDGGSALVTAFRNSMLDELTAVTAGEIWEAPGGLPVNWSKGWRKGTKHS